jgi:hypothetical protein
LAVLSPISFRKEMGRRAAQAHMSVAALRRSPCANARFIHNGQSPFAGIQPRGQKKFFDKETKPAIKLACAARRGPI